MISTKLIQAINTAGKYPYIIRVGVFGSYARNEETPASDIDILIDYDNSSLEYLDNLDDFLEDMERVVQAEIGIVTLRGLLKSNDEKYKRNVLNDVQWVYVANLTQP